jgi:hypothetical protein
MDSLTSRSEGGSLGGHGRRLATVARWSKDFGRADVDECGDRWTGGLRSRCAGGANNGGGYDDTDRSIWISHEREEDTVRMGG